MVTMTTIICCHFKKNHQVHSCPLAKQICRPYLVWVTCDSRAKAMWLTLNCPLKWPGKPLSSRAIRDGQQMLVFASDARVP